VVVEEEEEWTGFGDAFITPEVADDGVSESREPSIAPPPSTVIGDSSPYSTPKKPVSAQTAKGTPMPGSILNLDGPPSTEDSQSPSAKKKRRNRRKKNKSKNDSVS